MNASTSKFIDIVGNIKEKGWGICHPFSIDSNDIDYIKSQLSTFKESSIKKGPINYRTDHIKWLDENNEFDNKFLNQFKKIQSLFDNEPFLKSSHIESHYALYDVGNYYKRHKDSFVRNNKRILSMVTYLNQDWKELNGGHLTLYLESGNITIEPILGTTIIFCSDIEHEVSVSHSQRLSIATWFNK